MKRRVATPSAHWYCPHPSHQDARCDIDTESRQDDHLCKGLGRDKYGERGSGRRGKEEERQKRAREEARKSKRRRRKSQSKRRGEQEQERATVEWQ